MARDYRRSRRVGCPIGYSEIGYSPISCKPRLELPTGLVNEAFELRVKKKKDGAGRSLRRLVFSQNCDLNGLLLQSIKVIFRVVALISRKSLISQRIG